jgi:hypothetical protein
MASRARMRHRRFSASVKACHRVTPMWGVDCAALE